MVERVEGVRAGGVAAFGLYDEARSVVSELGADLEELQSLEPDAALGNGGLGLTSMRERTEGLGGRVEVISDPGRGTTLTFTIPLTDQRQSTSAAGAGKS